MPHTMVTFRLHRSGVILLVVFVVVLAILIYVAGYLTAVYTRPAAAERRAAFSPPKAPAPPPKGRTEARPPSAEPKESLTLRLSVLTSEDDAKAELARLTGLGLKPEIVQMPTTSGVTLYNVVVGRYETRSAANAAAGELQSRLGFTPVIIPAQPSGNL